MSDCEWMFGDVAEGTWGFAELAHLNPLRWSGSLEIHEAVIQMQEVLKADGGRPVLVKVPSGVQTAHQRFEKIEEAIVYLKKNDPKAKARAEEKEKLAGEALKEKEAAEAAVATVREEVAAKEDIVEKAKAGVEAAKEAETSAQTHFDKAKSEVECTWMFADAGKGLLGFSEVARFNPLRWSGNISIKEGIAQLQSVQAETPDRGIDMKVLGGQEEIDKQFQTPNEAIACLETVCPARTAARVALEEATVALEAAKAKLDVAEADVPPVQTKLQEATSKVTEAEANLESAKKEAAEAKAELDEATAGS